MKFSTAKHRQYSSVELYNHGNIFNDDPNKLILEYDGFHQKIYCTNNFKVGTYKIYVLELYA